jgi:hypothetical protein
MVSLTPSSAAISASDFLLRLDTGACLSCGVRVQAQFQDMARFPNKGDA